MGNKKATGFLCLRLVPCFAYVGAEDNRKGIPFVKIVSLLCKLIQFLMVALSVTVHKALILLVFLNHPYQSLAFKRFVILKSTLAILISSWSCLRKTYFCFKGADSEVNLAKIIQTEVTFAKRKLNLLFTTLPAHF